MTTTTLGYDLNERSQTEVTEQGVWEEEMTQTGLRRVVWRRPLPMQLLGQYAQAAVRRAVTRQLGDGSWHAEIEGFTGVWTNERSQKEALDALEEVVFEWVLLKIRDEDRDMPVLESLDLNSL
jgi:predicted RNase H-like HicB family nuclease